MSRASQESRQVAAPLASRVAQGADAVQIGDAMFALWEEIDDALTPILGQRGMVALHERSLHIAAVAHSWLAVPDENDPPVVVPHPGGPAIRLNQVAARQSAAEDLVHVRHTHLQNDSLSGFELSLAPTFRKDFRESLVRPYSIDGNGIQMGDMLGDQEGLLGGRPTRKRVADLPVAAPVPRSIERPRPPRLP